MTFYRTFKNEAHKFGKKFPKLLDQPSEAIELLNWISERVHSPPFSGKFTSVECIYIHDNNEHVHEIISCPLLAIWNKDAKSV